MESKLKAINFSPHARMWENRASHSEKLCAKKNQATKYVLVLLHFFLCAGLLDVSHPTRNIFFSHFLCVFCWLVWFLVFFLSEFLRDFGKNLYKSTVIRVNTVMKMPLSKFSLSFINSIAKSFFFQKALVLYDLKFRIISAFFESK